MRHALNVVAAGARTSLGFDLASSAAAARAGITAFADHPFMIDRSGAPMAVARDADLALDLDRDERLARLAAAAAQDAFEQLPPQAARVSLMIVLALPLAGDAAGPVQPAVIAQAVRNALADRVDVVAVRASHAGHVAGIAAAQVAAQAAADGFDGYCLLLGVDSWLDAATLEWLDEAELLAVRTRPFGFVPGEAAVALLIAPRATSPSDRTRATIECGDRAHESEAALASDQPRLGRALSAAARSTLRAFGSSGVPVLYADLNGIPERADEVGYSVIRVREHLADELRTVTPAEWFGDVGAATVPLMVALAAVAAAKSYGAGAAALILAQSLGTERGAMLLSLPQDQR
jgi:3-oxoacyl-[acyl-carrier-protein] synthase I